MLHATARIVNLMPLLAWMLERGDPVSLGHALARNAGAIETTIQIISRA